MALGTCHASEHSGRHMPDPRPKAEAPTHPDLSSLAVWVEPGAPFQTSALCSPRSAPPTPSPRPTSAQVPREWCPAGPSPPHGKALAPPGTLGSDPAALSHRAAVSPSTFREHAGYEVKLWVPPVHPNPRQLGRTHYWSGCYHTPRVLQKPTA